MTPVLPVTPVMPSRAASASFRVFVAYGAVALVDLLALCLEAGTVHHVAKVLLLPLLAVGALLCAAPRLLVVALVFGWAGDVLLMFGNDLFFLAGMGAFAAGHVSYLVLFLKYGTRYGAPRARVRSTAVVLGTLALMVAVLALLWTGLPGVLRIPVTLYCCLLTAMGLNSGRLGPVAALGGALFMVSDTLLATGLAGRPDVPVLDFWVMLTYTAAQLLLVIGALRTLGRAGGTAVRVLPEREQLRSA